jgi:hypothetical protein
VNAAAEHVFRLERSVTGRLTPAPAAASAAAAPAAGPPESAVGEREIDG